MIRTDRIGTRSSQLWTDFRVVIRIVHTGTDSSVIFKLFRAVTRIDIQALAQLRFSMHSGAMIRILHIQALAQRFSSCFKQ